jgi:hypothetical protein
MLAINPIMEALSPESKSKLKNLVKLELELLVLLELDH